MSGWGKPWAPVTGSFPGGTIWVNAHVAFYSPGHEPAQNCRPAPHLKHRLADDTPFLWR